jgi:hypothetical protein
LEEAEKREVVANAEPVSDPEGKAFAIKKKNL